MLEPWLGAKTPWPPRQPGGLTIHPGEEEDDNDEAQGGLLESERDPAPRSKKKKQQQGVRQRIA